MRTKHDQYSKWWIGLALTALTACSSFDAELAALNEEAQAGASTRADLITYTINDLQAGTLADVIAEKGYGDAQKLIITGTFRHDDSYYIRDNMPSVEVLDLSGASFYTFNSASTSWNWKNNIEHITYTIDSYSEETVNYLPDALFNDCSNLVEIILPNNLTSLGSYAFMNCSSLESISIPENVSNIGYECFYGCSSLKSITFPQNLNNMEGEVFAYCTSLTEVDLSMLDNLRYLPWSTFYGCTSLATAKLPDSITKIGDYAFSDCAISDFSIFKNVTTFNYAALRGCKFKSVDLSNVTNLSMAGYVFSDCTELTSIQWPTTMTRIEEGTFKGCTSLTSYTVPSQITQIGPYAFAYTGISENTFSFPSSITTIPEGMFEGCENLTSYTIPSQITEIGSYAFRYSGISSISSFPSNITTITDEMFRGCSNLTSFTVPDQITEIGDYAFGNCTNLSSITFSNSNNLKTIGSYAFRNTGFTEFTIPSSVTEIGDRVFEDADQLKTVTVPSSVTKAGTLITAYCDNLITLVWKSTADVGDRYSGNSNCYLIIYSDGNGNYPTYGPNWTNVIKDGMVDEVVLSSNNPVTFPVPVTAKKVTYTKYFSNSWMYQTSNDGSSHAWRTISLPFTVTSITSENNGTLAPFNSNVEGAKPFWLRELTTDGFKDVTEIKANHPYIICMPNNTDIYLDGYNIWGNVTFVGENYVVDGDDPELVPAVGSDYTMYPTYEKVERAGDVYALNTDYEVEGYNYGSVFVHSAIDVNPYEAYIMNNTATLRSVIPIDNKRVAVRSAKKSSGAAQSRGVTQKRKPRIDDM
jgi:hypothetical protein